MESVEVKRLAQLLRVWYAMRVWFWTYKEAVRNGPGGLAEFQAQDAARKFYQCFRLS